MIAQLQDIIPALTGFFLGLIVLVYFVFKKNLLGMVISSISCILLMFIFKIISVNLDKLNSFFETYKNILNFPFEIISINFDEINSFFEAIKNILNSQLGTVLVTTASIFLGNTLIRYFTDRKEKREFAILFMSAIGSHINVFSKINLSIVGIKNRIFIEGREYIEIYTEGREYIEISKSNLIEDKRYDIAFNKIGIFNESEIDLVSFYNIHLKESLFLINIFCNVTKIEYPNLTQSFTNIQIVIPITKILGYLCIYHLSLKYSQQSSAEYREDLLKECNGILITLFNSDLFPKYEFDGIIFPNLKITFNILQRITSDTLIETLNYIRERFRKIDKAKDTYNRKPIYLFRILINTYISLTAILKNRDRQTSINIISSQETFTNLTWQIPDTTFVTHAKKMLKSYIKEKLKKKLEEIHEIKYLFLGNKFQQNILEKDIDGLEEHLDEDIDKFIGDCECESYIISPWGTDIDSLKIKFSQI
ncbi:hypothetical protein [Dapis sp. BLCC M172]|uniref:hypothetical protein n=1 Tax=Dapis sp. BLCC M172 TaxID=2975281 RepID=UPI003CE9C008